MTERAYMESAQKLQTLALEVQELKKQAANVAQGQEFSSQLLRAAGEIGEGEGNFSSDELGCPSTPPSLEVPR